MDIPINSRELNKIIEVLKKSGEKDLYAKLWTFKVNELKEMKS